MDESDWAFYKVGLRGVTSITDMTTEGIGVLVYFEDGRIEKILNSHRLIFKGDK